MHLTNKYKVEVWTEWNEQQRRLFTELYERMVESPWAFQHPLAVAVEGGHWRTTAWNAAWMAADMLKGVNWLVAEEPKDMAEVVYEA